MTIFSYLIDFAPLILMTISDETKTDPRRNSKQKQAVRQRILKNSKCVSA